MRTDQMICPTPDDLPDWTLVKNFQDGDHGAFKVLVDRYQQRSMRLAYSYVRSQEDSKDVVQEAFLRVFKSINKFRNDSRFYTWFYRILVNVAIDHLRRNKYSTQSYDDSLHLHSQIGVQAHPRWANPAEGIWTGQLRKALVSAISSLPVEQRMAITLREYEGLSYEEIAKVTKTPIGTVMSRLFYARQRLQGTLREFMDPSVSLSL